MALILIIYKVCPAFCCFPSKNQVCFGPLAGRMGLHALWTTHSSKEGIETHPVLNVNYPLTKTSVFDYQSYSCMLSYNIQDARLTGKRRTVNIKPIKNISLKGEVRKALKKLISSLGEQKRTRLPGEHDLAERLGVSQPTVVRKLRKHGINLGPPA